VTILANYSAYFLLGLGLSWLSVELQSTFLKAFFINSLLVLEVALLAINTAARTALLGKLKDIGDGAKIQLRKTAKAMSLALIEQLALIGVTVFFLMLYTSPSIASYNGAPLVLSAALFGCFVASVQIVYDTSKAIMVILDEQAKE
jgi:hypothetical protein